jgi:hypothetical protein
MVTRLATWVLATSRCRLITVYSSSVAACITPQYRDGRKLSPRELADLPQILGILHLASEQGRDVMRLLQPAGDIKNIQAELWLPVLTAMFSDTSRLSGIEKARSGAWVHQSWYCVVGGALQREAHRAARFGEIPVAH